MPAELIDTLARLILLPLFAFFEGVLELGIVMSAGTITGIAAAPPWLLALAAGLLVAVSHYGAHMVAGEEWAFEPAGADAAGGVVALVTAVVVYLALRPEVLAF